MEMPFIQIIGIGAGCALVTAALEMIGFHRSVSFVERLQLVFVRGAPLLIWFAGMITYPAWVDRFAPNVSIWIAFGGLATALVATVVVGRVHPASRAAMAYARKAEALERREREDRLVRRTGRGWFS